MLSRKMGLVWLRCLCSDLEVASLAGFGMDPACFEEVAQKAAASSSMKGNPVALTGEELACILSGAMPE